MRNEVPSNRSFGWTFTTCLESTGTRPGELDLVAFYDKPLLKFERLLETYLAFAPHGFRSFRQALPPCTRSAPRAI